MPRHFAPNVAIVLLLAPAVAAPLPKEAERPPLYYPIQVGAKWVYRTDGVREEGIVVDKVEQVGREVVVERAGAGENTLVYTKVAVSAAGLRHVGTEPDGPPVWLLKTPFKGGECWKADAPEAVKRTVRGTEEVTVPAGKYRAACVVVEAEGEPGQVLHWYAPGIGEVKRVIRSADGTETVRRALVSFSPGKD